MIEILEGAEAWSRLSGPQTDVPGPKNNLADTVREILGQVRAQGDAALRSLAEKFGDASQGPIAVVQTEIDAAGDSLSPEARGVLERAAGNIRVFAEAVRDALKPVRLERDGFTVGLDYRPVSSAGCYVPGGRHPLPSSALMTAVTARAAGVASVHLVCPRPTPEVLYCAKLAGVDSVFRAGGAQAIAALAFGTESVPAVDVVAGPGNAYVTEAKRQLQGRVGIDLLAGPSEVAIIADGKADPSRVALDLLAQWEHDPKAIAWLLTDDRGLAEKTARELDARSSDADLPAFLQDTLKTSALLVFESLEACAEAANRIAPEHLHLAVENAGGWKDKVENYGALFLGQDATVPFGDYMSGPNHTLPTGRTARYSGGLTVLSFLRPQSWLEVGGGRARLASDTAAFAEMEGLLAHAKAARARG